MKNDCVLLVMNLQKDFTLQEGRSHACLSQIHNILPNINEISQHFQQDGGHVVYVKTEWSNPIVRIMSGKSLTKGSPGAELDHRLKKVSCQVFTKNDRNIFSSQSFCRYLQIKSIRRIFLVGIAADQCIKISANKAIELEYEVSIIKDCVAAHKCEYLEKAYHYLSSQGIELIKSEEMQK